MLKHQLHALKQQEQPNKPNTYLTAAIRSIDTIWAPIVKNKANAKQSILDCVVSRPVIGPAIVAGLGTFTIIGSLYLLLACYNPGIAFALFEKVWMDVAIFGSF